MAAIVPTLRRVKADPSARCLPFDAGGSGSIGDLVYVSGDSAVSQASANSQAAAQVRGMVVAIGTMGATAFTQGDRLSVCMEGLVEVAPSVALTPGAPVYVSVTAGAADQTAPAASGKYPFTVGWAYSATAIYVRPHITVPTVNP